VEDAMMDSEFLRKKARALELLADSCSTGPRHNGLRELADEFQTKADRDDNAKIPAPYIYSSKAHRGGGAAWVGTRTALRTSSAGSFASVPSMETVTAWPSLIAFEPDNSGFERASLSAYRRQVCRRPNGPNPLACSS